MIKRRLLSYDIPQLTKVFKKDFPQLVTMAEESESAALFKEALRSFVFSRIDRTVGGSNRIPHSFIWTVCSSNFPKCWCGVRDR